MSSISNIAQENEQNILSVSQISAMIQNTLTSEFSNIRIRGEISGLKVHTSGHVYFSLKDESSVINAICWRGQASKLNFKLEEGLEVIAYGTVNTYPARSNYQIICSDIKVAGVGALMAMLEERKKKLAAEGLFNPERKRALPYMPNCIGIITSPTGAVIKDILHRISDRFGVRVLLYPVAVQGEGAAEQVAEGIRFFNESDKIERPDVLIVARGGGSIEDLWAFNEEVVVRAAANSNIPLISAVGHETDTTLIDYASDKRAPTPTAAAEMAVPVKAEIMAYVMDLKTRGYTSIIRYIDNLDRLLKARAASLISPKQMLQNMRQRIDDLFERLNNGIGFLLRSKESEFKSVSLRPEYITNLIRVKGNELEAFRKLLDSYNYKNVMKRGYSLVRDDEGKLVTGIAGLVDGSAISIEMFDGSKGAVINGEPKPIAKKEAPEPKPKKTTVKRTSVDQGSLF